MEERVDIIVIDDDMMAGELTKELLEDVGFKVLVIYDSSEALEKVKEIKPKLVITDIMMPGINGMEICKRIKSNKETKDIKVVVLSGKSYEKEKQRAYQFGADYFISKPYNTEKFSAFIKEILEGSNSNIESAPPPPPTEIIRDEKLGMSDLDENTVRVNAYGIRSMPALLPDTKSNYGRQTLCYSIETKNDILILDAGSGIVNLSKELMEKKKYYKNIWLFLTHFHIDNTIGLPYFEPLLNSKYTINIVGPNDPERSLKDFVKLNLFSSLSPIPSKPKAKINIYEVMEENYEISDEIKMSTMYSNHPTTTMIYFFNIKGIRICYAPDSEIWDEASALQDYNERLGKFSYGFDLFIHDTFYNSDDYIKNKNKGHSANDVVTEFAVKNKIKKYVMTNINPEYDDDVIDKMIISSTDFSKKDQSSLEVMVLREGENIKLLKPNK